MSDSLTNDHEAHVLEVIHQQAEQGDHPAQRDIAHAVGLSLGMTNAILKRLVTKGFVTMKRLNGRNIHYLVTPSGIEMIAKRSYRYLRRTVGHIVRYKERFREWLNRQKAAGIDTVILVGPSDLDFLVQWCVENEEMHFERHPATDTVIDVTVSNSRAVTIFSEKIEEPDTSLRSVALSSILTIQEH